MPTPRENLNCCVFFTCLDKTFFTWVGGKQLNFKVDNMQEFFSPLHDYYQEIIEYFFRVTRGPDNNTHLPIFPATRN